MIQVVSISESPAFLSGAVNGATPIILAKIGWQLCEMARVGLIDFMVSDF
jgi:hypothetical protein